MILACAQSTHAEPAGHWLNVEPPRFRDARRETYHAAIAATFSDQVGFVGGCFQMLTLIDDGRPEEIVYLDCSTEKMKKQALIVHLVARESVWQVLHSKGFEAASNVEVSRTDAYLNASDSRALRNVTLRLAKLAKFEGGTRHRELGEDYHFSTCEFPSGCLGAVARTPPPGSPAARLVEIGRLLAQAADASKAHRVTVLKAVQTKIHALSRWIPDLNQPSEASK
jgi:hypothetical protein